MDNKDKIKQKGLSHFLNPHPDLLPKGEGEGKSSPLRKGARGILNHFSFKLSAFTLVELIVGVTISTILMVSIWVFVSSGMQNIFLQQSALQNMQDINSFAVELNETISSFNGSWGYSVINTGSMIFKRDKIYDKWWFSYIWVTTQSWTFCDEPSEDGPKPEITETKHIFIKNFIPFMEDWESVTWDILKSNNLVKFNLKEVESLQKEHKIVYKDWETLVWKWVFWNEMTNWGYATGIYLNSLTWLASDNEGKLYISDTLNNRILYLSWSKIYTLLDENDWLSEPTGLFIENGALYIANSWSGEILKFSSPKLEWERQFSFSWAGLSGTWLQISVFSNWKIFKNLTNTWITLISENFQPDDIPTPPIPNKDYDTIEATSSNWIVNYKFVTKTYSWWILQEPPKERTMDFGSDTYEIKFNDESIFWAWIYTIKLKIWDNEEEEFYFFTQWDGKIYTKGDNTLALYKSWLEYPTWIWGEDNFNEFDVSNLSNLTFDFDKENDIILKVPIESLEITKENDLINIVLKYYRNYNCYNPAESEEKVETFIAKINLKN